jgi:hypothetical protein
MEAQDDHLPLRKNPKNPLLMEGKKIPNQFKSTWV